MFRKLSGFLIIFILAACGSDNPRIQKGLAEQTAVAFFEHLSEGRYDKAAEMYAGDYTALASLTTLVSPHDYAGLWKNGCEISGMQCLPIKRILGTEKFSLNEFIIHVEFRDKDGGVLEQGPCCGATIEDSQPISRFVVYVIERDGRYYVTSLPVFQP